MIVIVWSIIISSSLYGFISLNQKVTQLKERQENYVIKMHAESDYIVSKTSSNTSVFDSLQGEPLMIVSTDEHEGVLELTVLGSTERLINWINTVDEKEPSRRIEIEDIERKGNVVYVHCAVKPIMRS